MREALTVERPLDTRPVAVAELGELAGAEAARSLQAVLDPLHGNDARRGKAERIQDMTEDEGVLATYFAGLGSLPVGQAVERSEGVATVTQSLLYDMEQAAAGKPEALRKAALLVLFEGALSEGVSEVEVTRDENGELAQDGHRVRDVLQKAIELNPGEHPGLHDITKVAGIDLYTWDMLDEAGYFDNGDVWIVPRLIPTGVPAGPIRKYGYFENLAVSWSIIWKRAPGTFVLRNLMTAGVEVFDHEESETGTMTSAELDAMFEARLLRRHDIQGVRGVYRKLGLPVPDNLLEFHRGLRVPRSYFEHPNDPNADVARWNDDVLGSEFFVGRRAPKHDYVEYGRRSIAAMRDLEPLADQVAAEFMSLHYGQVTDEMQLARLLARIGRRHIIDYVIDNPDVDARPLGLAAVAARADYWRLMESGDMAGAGNARQRVHRTARVNMCGFGESGKKDKGSDSNEDVDGEDEDDDQEEGESSEQEMCLMDSNMCWCCKYNSDGSERSGQRLWIKALHNGGRVHCLRWGCGAWMDESGDFYQGRIAERAERARAEAVKNVA